MKFHWGHGIFVFYVLFIAIHVLILVQSRTFDNSLVDDNYYARDINYQQEFDRRQNSNLLADPLRMEHTGDQFTLQFPAGFGGKVTGTLLLYRPSTQKDDRLLPLEVNEDGSMPLSLTELKPGQYKAIVEWSAAGTDYYDELNLYVKL